MIHIVCDYSVMVYFVHDCLGSINLVCVCVCLLKALSEIPRYATVCAYVLQYIVNNVRILSSNLQCFVCLQFTSHSKTIIKSNYKAQNMREIIYPICLGNTSRLPKRSWEILLWMDGWMTYKVNTALPIIK